MKRRTFLGTSAAGVGVAGALPAAQARNQYFELCFYRLSGGTDQGARLAAFLEKAHLPMTKRLGIRPVGYFELREPPPRPAGKQRGEPGPGRDQPCIVTVTVYDSWSSLAARQAAQRADKQWTAAVEKLTAQSPAYDRVESWLLRAFDGIPKIEVPPSDAGRKPRIFDLRMAECPSFHARVLKMEQWNTGEIQIFRECALHPVFFGESLYGASLPNFWFLVWYDDPAAREAAWEAFRTHPGWIQMQKNPRWAKTVHRFTDTFLQPLGFSPIR